MGQGEEEPRGELAIRALAMPADTNPAGDIFGGWVLSQMDIAGGVIARARAGGRVATVAIDGMVFHQPVYVGDVVCCHADIERVGNTSIRVYVTVYVQRNGELPRVKVTEGAFTYVAIGEDRRLTQVPKQANDQQENVKQGQVDDPPGGNVG